MKTSSNAIITIILAGLVGGCATSECLRLPISTKISDAVVARCQLEAHQSPERRDVFARAIKLAWARGLHAEMVSLSKWVLRHDPARSDARYYLAVGLRKLGQCDVALQHYSAYAKLRPDDPDPYFGAGLCHEALGAKSAAVAAYGSYLSREKREDRAAWRTKAQGRIAVLSGTAPPAPRRVVGVLRRLPKVAASAPLSARPAAARPMAARRTAARPAVSAPPAPPAPPAPAPVKPAAPAPPPDCSPHERAFTKDPFATKAYDAFADCAMQRKEYAKVIKKMRMAIRDNPDFARGWLQLGRAYKASGQTKAAQRALARACKAGVSEACSL